MGSGCAIFARRRQQYSTFIVKAISHRQRSKKTTSGCGVSTTANENKRFVNEFANPHSWLMTAENLHEQATEIYQNRSRSSITTKLNAKGEIVQQTRGIDKPVFLLGGFALENAIKAFLVYENPHWVSNGRLSGNLKSHSLTGLQKQSKLIPHKKSYIGVLQEFESGLDSVVPVSVRLNR